MKFEFAQWKHEIVRHLVRDKFGVLPPESSIGRVLRKLGLSPRPPMVLACLHDPRQVEAWLLEQYLRPHNEPKHLDAQIFFADEAHVWPDYRSGTIWTPVDPTPVVNTGGAQFKFNLFSVISPRGDLRFMCSEVRLKAERLIEIIKNLPFNRSLQNMPALAQSLLQHPANRYAL